VTVGDLRPRLNVRGHVDGDGAPDAGCLRPVVRTSVSGGVEFGPVKGTTTLFDLGTINRSGGRPWLWLSTLWDLESMLGEC
jgi:hypothetical protein